MNDESDSAAFDQYRLLIINWFQRIDRRLDDIERKMSIMQVDLVSVKIKAGLWGALAGAVPTAVAAGLVWLKNT